MNLNLRKEAEKYNIIGLKPKKKKFDISNYLTNCDVTNLKTKKNPNEEQKLYMNYDIESRIDKIQKSRNKNQKQISKPNNSFLIHDTFDKSMREQYYPNNNSMLSLIDIASSNLDSVSTSKFPIGQNSQFNQYSKESHNQNYNNIDQSKYSSKSDIDSNLNMMMSQSQNHTESNSQTQYDHSKQGHEDKSKDGVGNYTSSSHSHYIHQNKSTIKDSSTANQIESKLTSQDNSNYSHFNNPNNQSNMNDIESPKEYLSISNKSFRNMLQKMDTLVQNLVTEQASSCGTSQRSLISLNSKSNSQTSHVNHDSQHCSDNVIIDDSTLEVNQNIFMTHFEGDKEKEKDKNYPDLDNGFFPYDSHAFRTETDQSDDCKTVKNRYVNEYITKQYNEIQKNKNKFDNLPHIQVKDLFQSREIKDTARMNDKLKQIEFSKKYGEENNFETTENYHDETTKEIQDQINNKYIQAEKTPKHQSQIKTWIKSRNLDLKTSHLLEFLKDECKIYGLDSKISDGLFRDLNLTKSKLNKKDKEIMYKQLIDVAKKTHILDKFLTGNLMVQKLKKKHYVPLSNLTTELNQSNKENSDVIQYQKLKHKYKNTSILPESFSKFNQQLNKNNSDKNKLHWNHEYSVSTPNKTLNEPPLVEYTQNIITNNDLPDNQQNETENKDDYQSEQENNYNIIKNQYNSFKHNTNDALDTLIHDNNNQSFETNDKYYTNNNFNETKNQNFSRGDAQNQLPLVKLELRNKKNMNINIESPKNEYILRNEYSLRKEYQDQLEKEQKEIVKHEKASELKQTQFELSLLTTDVTLADHQYITHNTEATVPQTVKYINEINNKIRSHSSNNVKRQNQNQNVNKEDIKRDTRIMQVKRKGNKIIVNNNIETVSQMKTNFDETKYNESKDESQLNFPLQNHNINTEQDQNVKQSINSNPIHSEINKVSHLINNNPNTMNNLNNINNHSVKNISHQEHDPEENYTMLESKDVTSKKVSNQDDLKMRTPTVYTEKKDFKSSENKNVFNVVDTHEIKKDDQEMFYGKSVNKYVDINDIAFKNIKNNQNIKCKNNENGSHNLSISSNRNKIKKGKFKLLNYNYNCDKEMSFMDVNNISKNKENSDHQNDNNQTFTQKQSNSIPNMIIQENNVVSIET